MRPIPAVLALLSLAHPGCGEVAPRAGVAYESSSDGAVGSAPSSEFTSRAAPIGADYAMGMMRAAYASPFAPAGPPQDAPPPGEVLDRKIIYDARIDLVVGELDPAGERLVALVREQGGYIAEQDLAGSPGSRRTGRWKLRVPTDRFEEFVGALLGLGELQRNQRTSQDVTEQFYDVEARIRNKKVEEATLLKILEERGGRLEDVLKVEVELSRVRGEVEQLEGRLRVLENLSSLATVNLTLRERDDYAPTPPVAPDFPTRVARAWASSIGDLRTAGENVVLFVVALAPWLPLILVGLAAVAWVLRLLWRRLAIALPRAWELARRPVGPPRASP